MGEPKPVDAKTAKQLFLVGRLTGEMAKGSDPRAIKLLVKEIDADILEEYLKRHPEGEGFRYRREVEEAIRVVRTLKGFSG